MRVTGTQPPRRKYTNATLSCDGIEVIERYKGYTVFSKMWWDEDRGLLARKTIALGDFLCRQNGNPNRAIIWDWVRWAFEEK